MYVCMYVHVCMYLCPYVSMKLSIYFSMYVSMNLLHAPSQSSAVLVLLQGDTDTRWQCVGRTGQVQDHRL